MPLEEAKDRASQLQASVTALER